MKTKNLIALFSIFVSFTLFAQGPPGRGGMQGQQQRGRGGRPDASEILSILDTNNDDLIDKDEAAEDRRGKISEDFGQIDSDADGFIDIEELEAYINEKRPKEISPELVLKEVDQNEDGLLNELEVAAKDRRELIDNFKDIDINEDGQLDLEELKTFYANRDNKNQKKRVRH